MRALVALIDANVFYPAILRDLIIQLAAARLFHARWTGRIETEWSRRLLENRPDISEFQVTATKALMLRAVPDALVEGYESIVADFTCLIQMIVTCLPQRSTRKPMSSSRKT